MVIGQINSLFVTGCLDAFSYSGFKIIPWNKEISAFDLFDTYNPKIVLLDYDQYDEGIAQALSEISTLVILFGNDIPLSLLEIGKPDILCYSNISHQEIEELDKRNIKHRLTKNGSNLVRYRGKKTKEFNLGDVFLSYEILKDEKLIDIIYQKAYNANKFSIVGPIPFFLPNYLGRITDKELSNVMASSDGILTYRGKFINDIWANGGTVLNSKGNKPTNKDRQIKNKCIEENYFTHLINIFKLLKLDSKNILNGRNKIYKEIRYSPK
jgi:hypothetical protein